MKKIILILLLFISIINITYAIPIPALAIGYDFFIFLIPVVLTIFTTIFFYFKKYIFWINLYFFILVIFLYLIHYNITNELFLFDKEYLLFIIIIFLLGLIYKFKKINFFNYFLVILLISLNIFLGKIDYNLYEFKQISSKVEKNMYSNIKITKILYKDNFMAIYGYDIETKVMAYTVIENGLLDTGYYLNKGKYYIVHGGDRWLGKGLSDLVYKFIK